MANDSEAKEVNIIHGVTAHDGRSTVEITPLTEGRSPVSMTIQPNDLNRGRMPANLTPLTPPQPAAPVQPPAPPPATEEKES